MESANNSNLSRLSVRELRSRLKVFSVDSTGCLDKACLVDLLKKAIAESSSSFQESGLTNAQVAALTPEQIGALTSPEIASLTLPQIQRLTYAQMTSLTATHLASMSPEQLATFSAEQLYHMPFTSLQGITNEQLAAMSADQVKKIVEADEIKRIEITTQRPYKEYKRQVMSGAPPIVFGPEAVALGCIVGQVGCTGAVACAEGVAACANGIGACANVGCTIMGGSKRKTKARKLKKASRKHTKKSRR